MLTIWMKWFGPTAPTVSAGATPLIFEIPAKFGLAVETEEKCECDKRRHRSPEVFRRAVCTPHFGALPSRLALQRSVCDRNRGTNGWTQEEGRPACAREGVRTAGWGGRRQRSEILSIDSGP